MTHKYNQIQVLMRYNRIVKIEKNLVFHIWTNGAPKIFCTVSANFWNRHWSHL